MSLAALVVWDCSIQFLALQLTTQAEEALQAVRKTARRVALAVMAAAVQALAARAMHLAAVLMPQLTLAAVAVLATRLAAAALVGLALLFFVIQMLILPQHQQPGRQLLQ
jgi:hypothetical protein